MTTERFWVLGGEYSCPAFKSLNGQAEVLGPFDTREAANIAWKDASSRSGSALSKFAIASERIVLPN